MFISLAQSIIGKMQIIYQSPTEVNVQLDGNAVPLYCVASGHSVERKYEWQMSGQCAGCNTPVLWVKQPGLYRCHVEHHIVQESCTTKLICVVATDKGQCKTI